MEIYEAAFESAPDPIFVVDTGGTIIRANGEADRVFGFGPKGLEGRSVEELIPERFAGVHPSHRALFMASPKIRPMGTGLNLFARKRDGSEFPIDIMLSSASTARGPVAIAILRDMTEIRRKEAQLQEATERIRLSAQAAGMGYWTFDESTGALWMDEVAARLFGGMPADFPDVDSVRRRIKEEDREERQRKAYASLDAQGDYESEFRVVLPDGSERWLRDRGHTVGTGAAGTGRRLAGVTYDISARKRLGLMAQEAFRREQELYKLAPDGIFVANMDGRYTDVNAAGCRLLGMAREEIIGRTILDFIPPEDVTRLADSKQRLLQGEIDVSEWRLRRKDGSFVPVEVSAKIFPDGRWLGIVRDVTERKQAQARQEELVRGLQDALRQVKELKGLLPICAHCKRIRDDSGQWQQLESYIHSRTNADFSHGICPECGHLHFPDFFPAAGASEQGPSLKPGS